MSLVRETDAASLRVIIDAVRDIAPTNGRRLGGGLGIHQNSSTRLANQKFDLGQGGRLEKIYLTDYIILYKKATAKYEVKYISVGFPKYFVLKIDQAATQQHHRLDKTS